MHVRIWKYYYKTTNELTEAVNTQIFVEKRGNAIIFYLEIKWRNKLSLTQWFFISFHVDFIFVELFSIRFRAMQIISIWKISLSFTIQIRKGWGTKKSWELIRLSIFSIFYFYICTGHWPNTFASCFLNHAGNEYGSKTACDITINSNMNGKSK